MRAGAAGHLDHAFEQLVRALGAVALDDGLDRLDPLAGLGRVRVVLEQVGDRSVERRHAYRGPYWPRLVWGRGLEPGF